MTINNFESLELNAIDVIHKRELNFLPVHFVYTTINGFDSLKVKEWVKLKLRGRFCIANIPKVNNNDKLGATTVVAFEDKKELTYFMLACSYARRN